MSIPVQPVPTAVGVLQSHFGTPPGTQDARKECENWQRLCDELLADCARLQTALEKERLDRICKDFKPTMTMAEVYATVDRTTTLDQIVADMR